ncbi:MAG: hypothetical protein NC132_06625 [Corallococcus sp.]|nr:hypothetical protein [Corallococcus sp.]MCM1360161.1 hypothetical protein [Corallococcus sp.]MCM1395757.1 hypothetical protein [Corallococcus sp.]
MINEMVNLLSFNGYAIGLGVEAAIALIAGVLLVLLLANVFAKREKVQSTTDAQSSALVTVEGEPVAVVADESPVQVIREINTVYVPVNMGEEKAETPTPAPAPEEEKAEKEDKKAQPIIINVYNNKEEGKSEEPAPAPVVEKEIVEVQVEDPNAVKFTESKTIEELYEELSIEQKSFFDELKNTALAKPNAVLSITKNYENVKIGKRSIIKLLIRRGVTVAEFILENDALKEYRLSSQNKKGKSKIKIRPTVLAVTELDTLRAAVDMIHLAYEQIIEE